MSIAYILNLFDRFCTLYALKLGVCELNPLMQSVPIMVIYKVVIVGVLCWWLSKRKEPLGRYGLSIATVILQRSMCGILLTYFDKGG